MNRKERIESRFYHTLPLPDRSAPFTPEFDRLTECLFEIHYPITCEFLRKAFEEKESES